MKHFITILAMFSFLLSFGQWSYKYGGTLHDSGSSIQKTNDGGYIITGVTNSVKDIHWGLSSGNIWLLKLNYQGDTVWTKNFGGWNYEFASSVQQTYDGGYIIVGTTSSYGFGYRDIWLLKTNAQGELSWKKFFGSVWFEEGTSVKQTPDHGYIVSGSRTTSQKSQADAWLIKTDSLGNKLWDKSHGGWNGSCIYDLQITADSGFISTGFSQSFGNGSADLWIFKTNSQGDTLWNKAIGGDNNDFGQSIKQTNDGGYIVTGFTSSYGKGMYDIWLLKTNAYGDTVWTKTYGGANDDYGYSAQQTNDGGYIITGKTSSYGNGKEDMWLLKTNSIGDTLWTKTFGGPGMDAGYSVLKTDDGGYIISGEYQVNNDKRYIKSDVWVIKTDSLGDTTAQITSYLEENFIPNEIDIFPNPFSNTTTIELPNNDSYILSVYDITGNIVKTEQVSGKFLMERENMTKGLYFIDLSSDKNTFKGKVIVK